jgi:hypothetical protein
MLTSTHLTLPSLPIAIVYQQAGRIGKNARVTKIWGSRRVRPSRGLGETRYPGKYWSKEWQGYNPDLIFPRVNAGLSSTGEICFGR